MTLPSWLIVLWVICGLFFLFVIADKLTKIIDILRLREPPK